MEIAGLDGTPLRGDAVLRVVLRTDLTPIPATVEVRARLSREAQALLSEGADISVGPDALPMRIVKTVRSNGQAAEQGMHSFATIDATGILSSCAAVADLLQRSVIREGTTMGAIYRSIGASAPVGSDFNVPSFACFIGMTPSFQIARVLQEEGAAVYFAQGRLQFRRLAELLEAPAQLTLPADRSQAVTEGFLERHAVPFIVSTNDDGAALHGRRGGARAYAYRPRADARVIANMGRVLVTRRKVRDALSPRLNAGARVDVAGRPHVVITAAHVIEQPGDQSTQGAGDQYTQLWLGELSA